jgi:hypothetical protein
VGGVSLDRRHAQCDRLREGFVFLVFECRHV